MRTAFIEQLIVEARSNPQLFLVVGDLGYSVVEPFAEEFPDRFLNAGVAEQNMTGLAAGLASEGYHVFTYSIANFPTTRCLEQIRNDVCYHNLPVTIVAVGGGVAYGALGYSHHAVQDYAFLRCLPGMRIFSPGDPLEARAALTALCRSPGPSYFRLGKNGEPTYHRALPLVEVGGFSVLHVAGPVEGPRVLLTTGTALECAMEALAHPAMTGWSVCTMPVWGSGGGDRVREFLAGRSEAIAVEEHLAAGGFGSYLRECIGNRGALQGRLQTCSLEDEVCGMVGDQKTLRHAGGLAAERIVALASATANR